MFVHGFPTLAIPERHQLRRLGPEPAVTQVVRPAGIAEPAMRFGVPFMNYRFLYPGSLGDSMCFGSVDLRAMSIYPSPGCAAPWPGVPTLGLKDRRVFASGWESNPREIPLSGYGDPNRLRLSPHTIYAPSSDQATEQATINHPSDGPHLINYYDKWQYAHCGLGSPKVTHRHRSIHPYGHTDSRFGSPPAELVNKTHEVRPAGFRAYRAGLTRVNGGQARVIDLADEGVALFARPGLPTLHIDMTGWPQSLRPRALDDTLWGQTEVQNQHRHLLPTGLYATQMGHSRSDSPYQWQSLHVGPPVASVPAGWDSADCGEPWVSNRVRELGIEGFDAADFDYEFGSFHGRMRVRRAELLPGVQRVYTFAWRDSLAGRPDFTPMRHYITPDGNAETFRKSGGIV